jgi:geranylgeranyl pyrophosphate synthase
VEAAGPWVPGVLAAIEARLAAIGAAHGARLAEHAGATIAAGGKRLRPLLVLVAAGAEPAEPAGLVRAGAAVELVHSATLVHDDVLDAAPLRRGRPTVWASAGRGAATAAGDLLFASAFAELARNDRADEIRALSRAGSALAMGELLQREDAWRADVPLERYLYRCELKTARLFEAACTLGVLEAGGSPADARRLAAFGRRIGLAFQLLDDVLDVSGPAERTGKHRGTDLLDGTVTLPFILARERSAALAAVDPRTITTPAQAETLCDQIAETGALEASRTQALVVVAEAKWGLPERGELAQRRALELVADSVVARYS